MVEIELLGGGRKETLGIQIGVAEELIQAAVKIIGARFCGEQNGWSRAGAILGGIVVSQNLEFLNGVDRGKNGDTAGGQLIVVYAVDEPIRTVGARTANGEGKGPTGGHFAAGCAGKKAIGVGLRGGSGSESGELHKVAAVEWELGNLLRGDDLAKGGISGFDGDGIGDNFNRRAHGSGGQAKIEFALLIDLQPYVFALRGLKPLNSTRTV